MSELSESIEVIRRLRPQIIKPNLSKNEISSLLRNFLFRVSDEVHEFYSLTDGLSSSSQRVEFMFFSIHSLSKALSLYRYYVKNYTEGYCYQKNWLPLISMEDHEVVMPGSSEHRKTYELIDLGDDFNPMACSESSLLCDFRTLTTAVVSAAVQLEREDRMYRERHC